MTLTRERLEEIVIDPLTITTPVRGITADEIKEMASRLLELEQKLAELEKEIARLRGGKGKDGKD